MGRGNNSSCAIFAIENRSEKEINGMITSACGKWKALVPKLFKGKYSKELKKKIFNNCVFLTLSYGCPDLDDKKKTIKKDRNNAKCNGEVDVRDKVEGQS